MVGHALTAVSTTASAVLHRIGWTPTLRSRSDIRVVFYHGIGDGSSPFMTSLDDEVPCASFVRQIAYLQGRYQIVSLDEATRSADTRTSGKPLCCITFDDGLASVYRLALPVLAERSIPATVFVNTAVVGNAGLLWQHLLNYLLHGHGLGVVAEALRRNGFDVRRTVRGGNELVNLCQRQFARLVASNALDKATEELGVDSAAVAQHERPYLDWEQINEMTRHGFTFCSHTASHFPLNAVDDTRMRREIDAARTELHGRSGASERFLSFPFGMQLDYGRRARDYALATGYDYVLEVEDGWNPEWRVKRDRCLRRVCLGVGEHNETRTYAAIEVRPLLKGMLKSIYSSRNLAHALGMGV
jgi:peptidoglycan/xylan/chitin deacetylase (PgdA/CDA1 family)